MDGSGTIYLSGWYLGVTDFDPDTSTTHELTNTSFSDMYLLKLR